MKIGKTQSGNHYVLTHNDDKMFFSPSDYLQLREHFAREIVEGLTDEMIKAESKEMYQVNPDFNDMEFMISMQQAYRAGAKWFRSQITGSK